MVGLLVFEFRLVDDLFCLAALLLLDAFIFTSSLPVTIFSLQLVFRIQYLPVVTSDDPLHVGHRGVADLHLLPVVMVVQETVPFEVFVNESEEGSSNICLYCVGPRRIEPNDVSSSSFLPFGLHIL